MRIRQTLWTLIAIASLAGAQTPEKKAEEPPKIIQKIIEIHYASTAAMAQLVAIPGVTVKEDRNLRVLVVAGAPDSVAAIEEMVKKLDVAPPPPPPPPPHPNVELTVYLVGTSTQSTADELPTELVSTAKQLHGIFAYKSYRMLDSFVVRGRVGTRVDTKGSLPGSSSLYSFHVMPNVGTDTPRMVRLAEMKLSFTSAGDGELISTDIDIAEGQKVVVGKSTLRNSSDAIILVVTAKVID